MVLVFQTSWFLVWLPCWVLFRLHRGVAGLPRRVGDMARVPGPPQGPAQGPGLDAELQHLFQVRQQRDKQAQT